MARNAKKLHVVTANDLIEGHSVFLTPEGWNASIADAIVAVTPEQTAELEALANRHADENTIVVPYLIEVSIEKGRPVPVLRREQIRASGQPTIAVGPDAIADAA